MVREVGGDPIGKFSKSAEVERSPVMTEVASGFQRESGESVKKQATRVLGQSFRRGIRENL